MKPRLAVISYTPYGTARPSASPGKSCTLTAIGSSDQVWPAFLKSPTSSPLFLGVCTDDRQPSRSERRALDSNVVELPPTVGVIRRGFHLFGIDVQRVVELAQQAAHRGRTDRVTRRLQLGAQRAQTTADPLLRRHRVAGCFQVDQLLEDRQDQGRFFIFLASGAPFRMRWRQQSRAAQ